MSVSTIQQVLFDIAPELETVDATALARVDRFIVRAQNYVNECYAISGNKYDEAVAYLAAHRLTLRGQKGPLSPAGGPVLEVKVDNASTRFADTSSAGPESHSETKYGREFDRIMATLPSLPIGLYEVI